MAHGLHIVLDTSKRKYELTWRGGVQMLMLYTKSILLLLYFSDLIPFFNKVYYFMCSTL